MAKVKRVFEKDGLSLESYQGTYSIAAHRFAVEKWWPVWAKFRIGGKGHDHYQDKDWPVQVRIGSRDTAIKVLIGLLGEMGCEVTIKDTAGSKNDPVIVGMDDDMPGTQKSLPGADIWAHAKKEWIDKGGNPF